VFSGRAVLLAEVRTEEERRYCARRRRPFQHLAARYAAKEAVFRGLRTGLIGAMRWRDVEVVSGPCGEPQLILGGETARLASAKGVTRCAVFLTHAGDYSMAAVPFVA